MRCLYYCAPDISVGFKDGCAFETGYLLTYSTWAGLAGITKGENHADVSWVVSTPRSQVPFLQLKPSLSDLSASERPHR